MSLILRPTLAQLPEVAMAAPLAVVYAIASLTSLKAAIKWPNDVLIGGKKVCGILMESGLRGREVNYAILGLGLNVSFDPAAFPEIATIATSLSRETGGEISPWSVLLTLLEELDRLYLSVKAGDSLYPRWREHLETLGQRVRVTGDGWIEEGVAQDVERDGSLVLRRDDGSIVLLSSGEVASLRPSP